MTTGLLLICYLTVTVTAAIYNYNETSQRINYKYSLFSLSGFRDVIKKDFVIGGLFPVYDCTNSTDGDLELLEAMLFAID